jgi:hypothetical protein
MEKASMSLILPRIPLSVRSLAQWLVEARNKARDFLPKETTSYPITKPFCEIEARLGVLKQPYGGNQRVTSSGPKQFNRQMVETFLCKIEATMESGVSRTHFGLWTQGGVVSVITDILGSKVCVVERSLTFLFSCLFS